MNTPELISERPFGSPEPPIAAHQFRSGAPRNEAASEGLPSSDSTPTSGSAFPE